MIHTIANMPIAIPNLPSRSRLFLQNQCCNTIAAAVAPSDAPPSDGRIFQPFQGDNFSLEAGQALFVWLRAGPEATGQVYIGASGWGDRSQETAPVAPPV